MRGLTRKGADTGSLDGVAFTIRRARTPAREPWQRRHLLHRQPRAAASVREKARGGKGKKREDPGHVLAAPLLTVAGEPPAWARPRSGRRRSVCREKGGGQMS